MVFAIKRIINKIYMEKILKQEQVYDNSECQLKYLFFQNRKSNKLLVVFSGFPAKDKLPVYNYVLKFNSLNSKKLYILDNFGSDNRGSYYLGEKGNFFIDRAVTQLIEKICIDNKIKKEDVITAGTSKGGFAALYFSLKNDYGASIVGEPQILLGNYLSASNHKPIYEYIIGEVNCENTKKLNSLLFNLITNETKTRLYIHCGKDGYHHVNHIKPFVDYLKIAYNLDLGDYSEHGEVGKYFPSFAINIIKKELVNNS